MPPKTRGRGSTRARGGGRGGAAAARAAVDAGEDAAAEAAPATTAKPEAGLEAKPTPSTEAAPSTRQDPNASSSAPVERATTISSTTSSPHPTPAPPSTTTERTQIPVQRLASLNPPRRGSPATTRGAKRAIAKPTFTGRRSKEERAALEKDALEREKERNREREAARLRRERDEKWEAKRSAERAARGRGGFSGAMSGPFSMGSSREDRKASSRGFGGVGFGSGSRAARVKDEDDAGEGSSRRAGGFGGGGSGGGGSGIAVKKEDGGYVSSEDDEDAEFPRKDINDIIEISSDDDQATPKERVPITGLPVRIGRREHQERTFGINTDASVETSVKSQEQAEAGQASASGTTDSARKGKSKTRDIEITGERKPFKGVWQDNEDKGVAIKVEQVSDDENMADAEPVGMSVSTSRKREKAAASAEDERKLKMKINGIAEPVLQTEEDRAEWARFQSNLRHIRAELGPEDEPAQEEKDEVKTGDAVKTEPKRSVRDNNVYLFQIPPLMPELHPATIKKESSDAQQPAPASASQPPQPTPSAPAVKVEENAFSTPTTTQPHPRFASGRVGRLRVHASGRTTLDWAGTSFELTPGQKVSFLQEVVSINRVKPDERVVPEDCGDAISCGRVKGKFVVVPDWRAMG